MTRGLTRKQGGKYFRKNLSSSFFYFILFISSLHFRMEMEEVVASVFDLMGKTSEPQLEEEFLKARVDNMFHVRLLQILTINYK